MMKWLLFLPSVAFAQVTPIEFIPVPEPGTLALLAAPAIYVIVKLIRYGNKK